MSCRINAISVSSALSTERRMDSSALGSTRYVREMIFGSRWRILGHVPELIWQSRSFGFQVMLMPIRKSSVWVCMGHVGASPRGDRGKRIATLS